MNYRYNEDKILQELLEYCESTYKKHYAVKDGWPHLEGFQVNDLFMSRGMSTDIYISNAIEYLYRYGLKDGKNKMDLYKAMHNIIFAVNVDHMKTKKEEPVNDEPKLDLPSLGG